MRRIEFTDTELENIHNLYQSGKSIMDLQKIYGCSQTVFGRVFKENGWQFRNNTQGNKKYSVNENFFDVIDSPDKAYIIGLLFADGCNHLKDNTIILELQSRDYHILNSISDLMESDRPLAYRDYTGKSNHTMPTYVLTICSRKICERLNSLGMIPRKSLTLQYPDWLDVNLVPFMLRGYIDGDGWVQKYRIGFMSTDNFCFGVQNVLAKHFDIYCTVRDMKRHYNQHTKTLDITNRKNIIPLVNLMFSEGNLYLERKYKKYQEFNFINNSLVV